MSNSLFEIHYCNIHKQLEKSKQTSRIKKSCILNVTVYFENMGMDTQKLKPITKHIRKCTHTHTQKLPKNECVCEQDSTDARSAQLGGNVSRMKILCTATVKL